jgi:hypothetical protein
MAKVIDCVELNNIETITSTGIKSIENKDSCSECINGNRREEEVPCKFCISGNSEATRSYCNIKFKTLYKVEEHQEMCDKLANIYMDKNHDYNDSFAKARSEVPNYTLGKLYDKFERFKQLTKDGNQTVKDESLEDTLIDMANYCIMELIERKINK